MDSETSENVQIDNPTEANGTSKTNTVQADFTDLTTVYVTISGDTGVYVKFGLMSVDVETNESLATGGSYNDTSLDGKWLE